MKRTILSLLFVTAFTCQNIKISGVFQSVRRCENDEVICYIYTTGYGSGLSCKFKETPK